MFHHLIFGAETFAAAPAGKLKLLARAVVLYLHRFLIGIMVHTDIHGILGMDIPACVSLVTVGELSSFSC